MRIELGFEVLAKENMWKNILDLEDRVGDG